MNKSNQWAGIALLAGLVLCLLIARFALKDRASSYSSPLPVIVEIRGDVAKPGVYVVRGASPTVPDALAAAGIAVAPTSSGISAHFQRCELRTGQLIRITGWTDEERRVEILPMDAAARLTLGLKLSLSDATEQELLLVPQMKPEYASAIVAHRDRRPWRSVDELEEIQGVGPRTVGMWKAYLEVATEF